MSLMFVFGIVCLGLVVLAAERERIVPMLDDMVETTQEQAALDSLLKDGSDGDSLSVAHKEGIEAETGNRADARKAQVLDVAAEKARARKYAMYMLGMSGSANSVEEGNQLNDDDKKLVTVLFHMFHKYVDESPFSLARRLLGFEGTKKRKGQRVPVPNPASASYRVAVDTDSSEKAAVVEMGRSSSNQGIAVAAGGQATVDIGATAAVSGDPC